MSKIQDLIKETEQRLEELRREKAKLEASEINERRESLRPLAKRAHLILCGYNHTDGCPWSHEEGPDEWNCACHQHWLGVVERALESVKRTPEKLDAILTAYLVFKSSDANAVWAISLLR